ncbi:MAG: hypothetical protein B6D76_07395 [gamma proteobacterium symbiont of Stewartia floridana]|nr:MAG: hypothetical protein B6D76_07395 [gamma proteobacterium symbiont of Stewartia floridana]RLW58909.1 MAG: hypothetical protein B6D75_11505 [gamma proteobacterium symbiont of Stewartia floridana]RLW64735.1 MAG: hypothetical protein B6D73_10920 [gamma proteobacterium symbiont of Stewartia floridana]
MMGKFEKDEPIIVIADRCPGYHQMRPMNQQATADAGIRELPGGRWIAKKAWQSDRCQLD